MTMFENVLVL